MTKVAYVGADDEGLRNYYSIIPILKIKYKLLELKKIEGNLAFTSKRGIVSLKLNNVSLKPCKVYCIGNATKDALKRYYGFECKVPEKEDSLNLADLIIKEGIRRLTLVTSNQYSRDMLQKLVDNEIEVRIIEAYEIAKNENIDPEEFSNYDALLFGSSKSFLFSVELIGLDKLKEKKIYAIGQPTARTIETHGLKPLKTFDSPDIRKSMDFIIDSLR